MVQKIIKSKPNRMPAGGVSRKPVLPLYSEGFFHRNFVVCLDAKTCEALKAKKCTQKELFDRLIKNGGSSGSLGPVLPVEVIKEEHKDMTKPVKKIGVAVCGQGKKRFVVELRQKKEHNGWFWCPIDEKRWVLEIVDDLPIWRKKEPEEL